MQAASQADCTAVIPHAAWCMVHAALHAVWQEFAVSVALEPLPNARLLGLVLDGALCDGAFYIAR